MNVPDHLRAYASHCPLCGEDFVAVRNTDDRTYGYCISHGPVLVEATRCPPVVTTYIFR